MRERDVERYLVESVKAAGGQVRKVQWIGRRGAPDRRVMLPGLCCWVEMKAPGEQLEPHQRRECQRMLDAGEDVRVIDSRLGVDCLLGEWRRTCRA